VNVSCFAIQVEVSSLSGVQVQCKEGEGPTASNHSITADTLAGNSNCNVMNFPNSKSTVKTQVSIDVGLLVSFYIPVAERRLPSRT
jgi:hypothetical protein